MTESITLHVEFPRWRLGAVRVLLTAGVPLLWLANVCGLLNVEWLSNRLARFLVAGARFR